MHLCLSLIFLVRFTILIYLSLNLRSLSEIRGAFHILIFLLRLCRHLLLILSIVQFRLIAFLVALMIYHLTVIGIIKLLLVFLLLNIFLTLWVLFALIWLNINDLLLSVLSRGWSSWCVLILNHFVIQPFYICHHLWLWALNALSYLIYFLKKLRKLWQHFKKRFYYYNTKLLSSSVSSESFNYKFEGYIL